jgi:hypothetical protein
MNLSFIELLEIICGCSSDNYNSSSTNCNNIEDDSNETEHQIEDTINTINDKTFWFKSLREEQMNNVAEILVQNVMTEQYFDDYQWPLSGGSIATQPNENDLDNEDYELEVEAIKLHLER